jgi:hypothetical protein
MFGQDRKPLQDGLRRLSGRLVQLAGQQPGYQVQAGCPVRRSLYLATRTWHEGLFTAGRR